jgi:hypothetical protein
MEQSKDAWMIDRHVLMAFSRNTSDHMTKTSLEKQSATCAIQDAQSALATDSTRAFAQSALDTAKENSA